MNKHKHPPVFTSLESVPSGSAESDGRLMTLGFLLDHGLTESRYAFLNQKQRHYIESVLCVVIDRLCDHLDLISKR